MAAGFDSSSEIQDIHPNNSFNGDVFQVAGLYAQGHEPVKFTEGQPVEKGREVLFPIESKDGIPGGDQRTYGMYFPNNFDAAKPTRLIIAAHGVAGGQKDSANPVMANEMDPVFTHEIQQHVSDIGNKAAFMENVLHQFSTDHYNLPELHMTGEQALKLPSDYDVKLSDLIQGTPHVLTLPDGRQYGVYVPPGIHYPAGVNITAGGVVTAGHDNPEHQYGEVKAAYAEANTDKNHIVVTLHTQQEFHPELLGGLIHATFKGWNFRDSATGYDPEGAQDEKYFFDVWNDLNRRAGTDSGVTSQVHIDPKKILCEGFSSGAQYLQSNNEQRPEISGAPVCKTIAMFASGAQEGEPLPKPGISELHTFAQDSGQHPNGGLDLSTWPGILAKVFDIATPNSQLEHNVPNLLLKNEMQANGMTPSEEHITSTRYFNKITITHNGVKVVEYDIKPPYTGHYVPGVPGAAFDTANSTPPSVLNGPHEAAVLAGFAPSNE